MQQDKRQNVSQKSTKSLRPQPDLRSFRSSRFHLIMDQEWPEVRDHHRGGGMHTKCIGENVHSEANSKGNQQKVHSVNIGRKQQYTGNVNEAERVIEHYDIPHEEDLQKQVEQDHQGILYCFS